MTKNTNNTQLSNYEEFVQLVEKNWTIFVGKI